MSKVEYDGSIKELVATTDDGHRVALMTKWLRVTNNPTAPKYPKTGDIVTVKSDYSFFLKKGEEWIVQQVIEYEPAYHKDEDGRDIRITFVGHPHQELNGVRVREVMA